MSDHYEPDKGELEVYVETLGRQSRRLQFLGMLAFLGLLLHIVACAITPALADGLRDYDDQVLPGWAVLPTMTGAWALISVVRFDAARRRLEALFEEVSDEVQWFVRGGDDDPSVSGARRPNIHVRLVVRDAARTQDLFFAPGRFGPAVYALASVVALFVSILALALIR